jgi:DNA-directed RNA polymerase specialized sigma24 family protein
MQTSLPRANLPHPGIMLWISPVDELGAAVDPAFLDASERIGVDFFTYRAREVGDESRAMALAERAVHRASRARKTRPVEDPVAYLFRTFTNLVDEELDRERRFVPLTEELLHWEGRRRMGDTETEVARSIEWREVLDSVSVEMQFVLWRLYWGFSVNEIAAELKITPNTLSQRLSRARKLLKKTLDRKRPEGTTSEVNETRRDPRAQRRGGLPPPRERGPVRPPEPKPRRLPG